MSFILSCGIISGKYFPESICLGSFENSGPVPVPNVPLIYSHK